MSGALAVAKKRTKAAGKAPKEPSVIVAIRCRPEYKTWLEAFAERERDTPTRLIDLGLIELAKKLGYEPPPKR